MVDLKTLLSSSKFPWAREGICFSFIDSLGTISQLVSSALTSTRRASCNSWLLGFPARMRGLLAFRQLRRLCRHHSYW